MPHVNEIYLMYAETARDELASRATSMMLIVKQLCGELLERKCSPDQLELIRDALRESEALEKKILLLISDGELPEDAIA